MRIGSELRIRGKSVTRTLCCMDCKGWPKFEEPDAHLKLAKHKAEVHPSIRKVQDA